MFDTRACAHYPPSPSLPSVCLLVPLFTRQLPFVWAFLPKLQAPCRHPHLARPYDLEKRKRKRRGEGGRKALTKATKDWGHIHFFQKNAHTHTHTHTGREMCQTSQVQVSKLRILGRCHIVLWTPGGCSPSPCRRRRSSLECSCQWNPGAGHTPSFHWWIVFCLMWLHSWMASRFSKMQKTLVEDSMQMLCQVSVL